MIDKDLELKFYEPFHINKQDVAPEDKGYLIIVWNFITIWV